MNRRHACGLCRKLPLGICVLFLLVLLSRAVLAQGPADSFPSHDPARDPTLLEVPEQFIGAVLPAEGEAVTLTSWDRIAFQSFRDRNWEIYILNPYGSAPARLTNSGGRDVHPDLDRTGQRIAFARGDKQLDLYVMNVDGSNLTKVSGNEVDELRPAWSPDGTRLAFELHQKTRTDVCVLNLTTATQSCITGEGEFNGHPAWSPDGSRLAYVSVRGGTAQLWMMQADGGNKHPVSELPYPMYPVWSPDGFKLAVGADSDRDGWSELWIMNADGGNAQRLYTPEGRTDIWPKSWTSHTNGQITFSEVSYVQDDGVWYVTSARLRASNLAGGVTPILGSTLDMIPAWATLDSQAPTSRVEPLPAVGPAQMQIRWSGQDQGPAGISRFEIQVKDSVDTAWRDFAVGVPGMSAQFSGGIGGRTYHFRSRAWDRADNAEAWSDTPDASTRIESLAPETSIISLPPFSRNVALVKWGGEDPGGSGIEIYDVQVRRMPDGAWNDWQSAVTITEAPFEGEVGNRYEFRTRGHDTARNVEAWPAAADATTVFHSWMISGRVQDIVGAPIEQAAVGVGAGGLGQVDSDRDGQYAGYGHGQNQYGVTWSKPGYGSVAQTIFAGRYDARFDVTLPPGDNVVNNGTFEASPADLAAWQASGSLVPTVTQSLRWTGSQAAALGNWWGKSPPAQALTDNRHWYQLGDIAFDHNGVLHMAWIDQTTLRVLYRQRDSAGTWSSLATVHTESSYLEAPPALAVDPAGNVHLAWQFGQTIRYARRALDASWSLVADLSGGSTAYSAPKVVTIGVDTVHVAWGCSKGDKLFLCHAQKDAAQAWSPAQTVDLGESDSIRVVALRGDVGGVVHGLVLASEEIQYLRRAPGGSWSKPESVASNAENGDLSVDGLGGVHVLWRPKSGDPFPLWYRALAGDGQWTTPIKLYLAPTDMQGWYPQLDIDERGVLQVVMSSTYAYVPIIYGQFLPTGARLNQWNIGDGAQLYPDHIAGLKTAFDRMGALHLVWIEEGPGGGDLYYAQLPTATAAADGSLTQTLAIPGTLMQPTLSLRYRVSRFGSVAATDTSSFALYVVDGANAQKLLDTGISSRGWETVTADMSSYAGKTVTLRMQFSQTAQTPLLGVAVDDVSLGSVYPDVCVELRAAAFATPGNEVEYLMEVGNRGGAVAEGTKVQWLPPASVEFVSAVPEPAQGGPAYEWNLGQLPGRGVPREVRVRARVRANTVAPTVAVEAAVSTTTQELEVLNNHAQAVTELGYLLYLPIIAAGSP